MRKASQKETDRRVVYTNRKAHHHYAIFESYEAGLVLKGPEVKSLRQGQASLDQSFARVDPEGLNLYNLYIAPYKMNTGLPLEPARKRKLLMKEEEIERIRGKLQSRGLALIPLELYFRRGWAKVTLGLAKGKRGPDKREDIRRRDLAREMEKDFKGKFRL